MKIIYEAVVITGEVETFVIDTISLPGSDKEYLGDIEYRVIEGDVSLLSTQQLSDMIDYCTLEHIRLFNDYMEN